MAASYPTGTKSFTTKLPATVIASADTNAIQDEIVALENGLLTGLAHDLVFPDSLYDIGHSGALRPRNLYLAGDATIGGALTTAGALTATGVVSGMTDLYTTAWTDYSATATIVGWSAFTTQKIYYKAIGKTLFVQFDLDGTSNATTATFTLPAAHVSTGIAVFVQLGLALDNGAVVNTGILELDAGASTLLTFTTQGGAAWTGSARKRIAGQFWYERT